MLILVELGLSSFIFCIGFTPVFRQLFLRLGLVDRPDSERKVHLRAVPRIGGVPIALAYTCSLALVVYLHPDSRTLYIQHKQLFRELLPAAGLVFLTGLLDDIFGLKPKQKLLGQLLAGALAVSFGARIAFVHLPIWASAPLSLLWLIGCTNAFNLIDGMDGLATGVSLIACITTAGVAFFTGNYGLVLATIPLIGALLAFLRYNFSPASVFLGDCGSLTIGFLLGCFSLIWSQHATNLLGMSAPLMAVALPLIDVCLSIARRSLRKTPIFQGDRGHIHHMVLGLGFSTRGATLILYAACAICAVLAVLANFAEISFGWVVLVLFAILVLIGIDRLGYVEWYAARRTITSINVLRAVQEEMYLLDLRRAFLQVDSAEACWILVRQVCWDLNLESAALDLGSSSYSEQFLDGDDCSVSKFQYSFGPHEHLVVTCSSATPGSRLMYQSLDFLKAAIASKVHSLEFAPEPISRHVA